MITLLTCDYEEERERRGHDEDHVDYWQTDGRGGIGRSSARSSCCVWLVIIVYGIVFVFGLGGLGRGWEGLEARIWRGGEGVEYGGGWKRGSGSTAVTGGSGVTAVL